MEDLSLSEQFKKLYEQAKVYLNLQVSYVRLHIAEYLIKFFSSMVLGMIIFLFLFFVLVFGSFAFAYWFGEHTGKWSLGFLIVAGFYLLLATLIFLFRKPLIIKPFDKLIITQMELEKLNDTEDEEEQ